MIVRRHGRWKQVLFVLARVICIANVCTICVNMDIEEIVEATSISVSTRDLFTRSTALFVFFASSLNHKSIDAANWRHIQEIESVWTAATHHVAIRG